MSEVKTEDMVTITVDGVEIQAPKNAMLIEVTDRANIHVPRFCYHEKLPVAANCRMCLVEVEKAPKPMPACATPVMDGMVVHTQSKKARDAQKSVMEFLLINHPLDCPICDQGGECELQDIAVGYGQDVSQYVEGKRVVFDKNIGPLIATELTRCIHCTRCVRFGTEIAGIRELGMTNRGENARIATYVEQAVTSEMSGNVIDVCPVGALTAKPSRYSARAWEMIQHASVAPHDCAGSNIYVHTLRGDVVRVVPRDNEAINEVWISDRDRFSYEGNESDDRLTKPMVKEDGAWQEVSWEKALDEASAQLKSAMQEVQVAESTESEDDSGNEEAKAENTQAGLVTLVSPGSTLEEMYLAQKLTRGLGSGNIDHRLWQSDFSDQDIAPVIPWLGQDIQDMETINAALLIGSNTRKEQPIINHRLRKAAVENNAAIHFLNMREHNFNFPLASNTAVAQQSLVGELAGVAKAALKLSGGKAPTELKDVLTGVRASKQQTAVAESLHGGEQSSVIVGVQASMHPQFSAIRALASVVANETNSKLGYLSEGGNTSGAWLAGAVPHRGVAGDAEVVKGDVLSNLDNLAAVVLLNIEPDLDSANPGELMNKLGGAESVVAISTYVSDALKSVATVLLPAATFIETSGTFVNVEGCWQSFKGVTKPKGEARPGWKILRVLNNMCDVDACDYVSSEQVRDELRGLCENIELDNTLSYQSVAGTESSDAMMRVGSVPVYAVDAMVRRSSPLQATSDAETMCATINSKDAKKLGLEGEETVIVKQGESSAQVNLVVDDTVPENTCWIPVSVKGNELLGDAFGVVELEKAHS